MIQILHKYNKTDHIRLVRINFKLIFITLIIDLEKIPIVF